MPTARADSVTTNANTAVKIAVLANDTGSSLQILSVTVPANGTATINTDKTITYTPKMGYTGSDSFQYTIRDGAGRKATGKVSVTVRNRAPVPGADSATTDAGTPVTIAVLANDSDPDGHALKINAVTQPANGAAAINPDKTITYRPAPGFTGADSFGYTVGDGHGGTAKATVAVTVRNRPPAAQPDSAVTDVGVPVDIAVLANDSDPDGNPLVVVAVAQPAAGTAAVNANGTLRYTPAAGFTGADAFTYTIADGHGGTAQGAVAVTVRNRLPLPQPDAATTDSGVPVTIAVLANDNDPDGHSLTVASVAQPANGTAAIVGGQRVTYSPRAGFTGTDGFTYTVSDGHGGTAVGAVSVTVRNRPPLPQPDSATTTAGTPVTIAVLANDNDPDGHPLSVTVVTLPGHGVAVRNGDNSVTYTPAAGFSGTDSFTYTVADGHGATAQGVVAITVQGLGEPFSEPFSDGTFFSDGTGWLPAA